MMWYFRVDGNETIGLGHVMRCLSVARALRRAGQESTFLLADDRPRALIEGAGFSAVCLNSQWDALEGETAALRAYLQAKRAPVLILDSYFVTAAYLKALGEVTKTVYIDDLNRFPYPVDLLINYNVYAERMDYPGAYRRAGLCTQFALGCAYVPLRAAFAAEVCRVAAPVARRLLIATGGTDSYNVADGLLHAFQNCAWFSALQYDVVVGKFNPYRRALEAAWAGISNVRLLYDVQDMAAHMRQCDLAVTAGGVTVYELMACGVPAVLYTLADNQLPAAHTLAEMGLMPYAGDIRSDREACLTAVTRQIAALRADLAARTQLTQRFQQLVDGQGADRLAKRLLVLREA